MSFQSRLAHLVKKSPLRRAVHALDDRLAILAGSRRGTFAQHGEDRFVLDYFQRRPGTYVDVGANHPIKISNTYLLYRNGWSGLTVEPITRLADAHRRFRPRDHLERVLVGPEPGRLPFFQMHGTGLSTVVPARGQSAAARGEVEQIVELDVVPLSMLIDRHLPDRHLDLLTVDTEGYDLQVLRSLDWSRHRPRLVIYEEPESAWNDLGQAAAEAVAADPIGDYVLAQGFHPLTRLGCNVVLEAN